MKSKRIRMIENNLKHSLDKYNNNELTYEQHHTLKEDADKRIKELKREEKKVMKVRVHYKTDTIDLEADTINDLRKQVEKELILKRGWSLEDCWSEVIKEEEVV